MLYFKKGSHLHQLVALLGVAGEFPYRGLHLLGKERVYQMLVNRLTKPERIKNPESGQEYHGRVLNVSGKGREKTIRLCKGAHTILGWIHPQADVYHENAFRKHHVPGDAIHRERNHRVAEALAVCMRTGLEYRPFLLPKLQNLERRITLTKYPVFYPARELKQMSKEELNKTAFTRMVGAIFCKDHCMAVYNSREKVMKWSGMGEYKTLHSLTEIARLNTGISEIEEAVLFAHSSESALATLSESDKGKSPKDRFDAIYRHVYFVPMEHCGMELLKILCMSCFKERILDCLFEPDTLGRYGICVSARNRNVLCEGRRGNGA